MCSELSIGNGSLQQYVAIPASGPFTLKPSSLSWTDAAALPLAYGTVFTALVIYGRLAFTPHPAEVGQRSVLILGGSSGTGSVGIQLAKKMGLHVVTTCSGRNIELVKKLGANEVIDYTQQHVAQEALLSKYAPYAVVLDCVGGTDLLPHLEHLILDDPRVPQLGIYITIVGDSELTDATLNGLPQDRADPRNEPRCHGRRDYQLLLPFASCPPVPRRFKRFPSVMVTVPVHNSRKTICLHHVCA